MWVQGEHNKKKKKVGVHFLAHNISRVKGHVKALGYGLGRIRSKSITHIDLHNPNNKLTNA
jgi:hypothetical protein